MKLSAMGRLALVGTVWLLLSLSTQAALTAVDLDGNDTNGHEGVYDDVLDITWLADANFAASNSFEVTGINSNGTMDWHTAEGFVAAMNAYDGGNGYLGVNNWRQPKAVPVNGAEFNTNFTYDGSSDHGYQLSAPVDALYNPNGQSPGFTGSEMAFHYYNNFDAIGLCSGIGRSCENMQNSLVFGIENASNADALSLFTNILNDYYWTGTETSLGSLDAFYYATLSGLQRFDSKSINGPNGPHVWPVAPGNVAANAVPVPAAVWLFGSGLLGLLGICKVNEDV